jgi:hypothetical protein
MPKFVGILSYKKPAFAIDAGGSSNGECRTFVDVLHLGGLPLPIIHIALDDA